MTVFGNYHFEKFERYCSYISPLQISHFHSFLTNITIFIGMAHMSLYTYYKTIFAKQTKEVLRCLPPALNDDLQGKPNNFWGYITLSHLALVLSPTTPFSLIHTMHKTATPLSQSSSALFWPPSLFSSFSPFSPFFLPFLLPPSLIPSPFLSSLFPFPSFLFFIFYFSLLFFLSWTYQIFFFWFES